MTFNYKLLGIPHFKISCNLEENKEKRHIPVQKCKLLCKYLTIFHESRVVFSVRIHPLCESIPGYIS